MKYIDSHAHLTDEKYSEDQEQIIMDLEKENIDKVIISGYSLKTSKDSILLANKYEKIYVTIGVSPNDFPQNIQELWKDIEELKILAKNKKVIGIGEIGLDYYWHKDNHEFQKQVFIKQIELANELNLPIAIHSRDAYIDTINVLKDNNVVKKGVFHCCQLNQELIKNAIELGFYISFAGPITFKNTKNAKDIVDIVPLDRILIETDSPYLSPEPLRGRRNEPKNVKHIAQKIADLKEIPIEKLLKTISENIKVLYNI